MNIPILITTCVIANADMTELSDSNLRLEAVISGLINLSKYVGKDQEIVLCDGSGYDFKNYITRLEELFNRVEILSFQNNINLVRKKGKGYGEGEIIAYALENSQVLSEYEHFTKLTGKLWLTNYNKCVNYYNKRAAFMFDNYFRPSKFDTRFYIIKKSLYLDIFNNAHLDVSDNNMVYLEHCFRLKINDSNNLNKYMSTVSPMLNGISGSTGLVYKPIRWKQPIKNTFLMVRSYLKYR
ncbi:hypothetical protein AB4299_14340 [Vibrio cyclitrophicus]